MSKALKSYMSRPMPAGPPIQRVTSLARGKPRQAGMTGGVLPSSAATGGKSSINAREFGNETTSPRIRFGSGPAGWRSFALIGLIWSGQREPGWAPQWHWTWQNPTHRWRISGFTFDEAFDAGIGRCPQNFYIGTPYGWRRGWEHPA